MEALVPGIALTNDTSLPTFEDWQSEHLPHLMPWFAHNYISFHSGSPIAVGMQAPASAMSFCSADQAGLGFSNRGHALYDLTPATMSRNVTYPYEPPRSHLPLADGWPHDSLFCAGFPDDVPEFGMPYRTLAFGTAAQQAPPSIPALPASLGHDVNAIIQLDPAPLPKNSTAIQSSSSCGSTKKGANFADDEMKTLITLYRPTEKKGLCRRRRRRPCAINVDELWIDKDDLHSGASKSSGTINVYECQWAKSTNPCGMWIIGTRFSVGAHIRKWHQRGRADGMVQCQWDGCAAGKPMLRDSINRHVVTVHFGEGFHCRRCNQEFSRKDVYTGHVRKNGLCLQAGAATVYGVQHRVVDTRRVLRRGGTIRFAD